MSFKFHYLPIFAAVFLRPNFTSLSLTASSTRIPLFFPVSHFLTSFRSSKVIFMFFVVKIPDPSWFALRYLSYLLFQLPVRLDFQRKSFIR
jgi:hypothetical protein